VENLYFTVNKAVGANASARVTFAPPTLTGKWRLVALALAFNEAIATDATDYVEITPKKGSTALSAVKSTAATAVIQGEVFAYTLTGVGTDLECTQAAPHHVLIDATPGAGKAVDVQVIAVYSQMLG
jgi:hypothetical protein